MKSINSGSPSVEEINPGQDVSVRNENLIRQSRLFLDDPNMCYFDYCNKYHSDSVEECRRDTFAPELIETILDVSPENIDAHQGLSMVQVVMEFNYTYYFPKALDCFQRILNAPENEIFKNYDCLPLSVAQLFLIPLLNPIARAITSSTHPEVTNLFMRMLAALNLLGYHGYVDGQIYVDLLDLYDSFDIVCQRFFRSAMVDFARHVSPKQYHFHAIIMEKIKKVNSDLQFEHFLIAIAGCFLDYDSLNSNFGREHFDYILEILNGEESVYRTDLLKITTFISLKIYNPLALFKALSKMDIEREELMAEDNQEDDDDEPIWKINFASIIYNLFPEPCGHDKFPLWTKEMRGASIDKRKSLIMPIKRLDGGSTVLPSTIPLVKNLLTKASESNLQLASVALVGLLNFTRRDDPISFADSIRKFKLIEFLKDFIRKKNPGLSLSRNLVENALDYVEVRELHPVLKETGYLEILRMNIENYQSSNANNADTFYRSEKFLSSFKKKLAFADSLLYSIST